MYSDSSGPEGALESSRKELTGGSDHQAIREATGDGFAHVP